MGEGATDRRRQGGRGAPAVATACGVAVLLAVGSLVGGCGGGSGQEMVLDDGGSMDGSVPSDAVADGPAPLDGSVDGSALADGGVPPGAADCPPPDAGLECLTECCGQDGGACTNDPLPDGTQCTKSWDTYATCRSGTCVTAAGSLTCGDGVADPSEGCDDGNIVPGDGCSDACQIQTYYRIESLVLVDPHVIYRECSFLCGCVCADVTNQEVPWSFCEVIRPLNAEMNDALTTDSDGDGFVDLGAVIAIAPPATTEGSGGSLDLIESDCDLEGGCSIAGAGRTTSTTFERPSDGTPCLEALPDTTDWTGSNAPASDCLVSRPATIELPLHFGGKRWATLSLRDAQIGAEVAPDPSTGLVNGLIRGFLPASEGPATPLHVGGSTVTDCTFPSGKDRHAPGCTETDGWWFHFNFTATPVVNPGYFGPCRSDADCDDGDLCTDDACDLCTKECVNLERDCDDGIDCTIDGCFSPTGECLPTPIHNLCPQEKECVRALCDPNVGCAGEEPLNDGASCTLEGGSEGSCQAGTCTP